MSIQFVGWSGGRKWGWFMTSVGTVLGAICNERNVGVGMDLES
jgi:hypothetical protein